MADKILFVSEGESFIINSMMKKINEEGKETIFSLLNTDELKRIGNEIDKHVYLYIGKIEDVNEDALAFLRDYCSDNNFELNILGHENDIRVLNEQIFKEGFAKEFYRPLNVHDLVEAILDATDDGAGRHLLGHVLVVDDSGTMLTTIREWLKDRYRVSMVNSASSAIAFLDKKKPDLILLDYEMPECNGADFLEMMRTDYDDIPVIFLTGHNDQETIKKIIGLKPAGYLLKSLPKEKIVGMIDTFFGF